MQDSSIESTNHPSLLQFRHELEARLRQQIREAIEAGAKTMWKSLRTTNALENLNRNLGGERRRKRRSVPRPRRSTPVDVESQLQRFDWLSARGNATKPPCLVLISEPCPTAVGCWLFLSGNWRDWRKEGGRRCRMHMM